MVLTIEEDEKDGKYFTDIQQLESRGLGKNQSKVDQGKGRIEGDFQISDLTKGL